MPLIFLYLNTTVRPTWKTVYLICTFIQLHIFVLLLVFFFYLFLLYYWLFICPFSSNLFNLEFEIQVTCVMCKLYCTWTESGEATAASLVFLRSDGWSKRWKAIQIAPPLLIASSTQDEVTGPSTETSPTTVSKERKRKGCVLDFLVAKAAREEEREKAAAERSEWFLSLFEKLVNKI